MEHSEHVGLKKFERQKNGAWREREREERGWFNTALKLLNLKKASDAVKYMY